MPHTPHTPGVAAATHPLTPGGPPSVSSIYNESNNSNINANHSSPAQNHSPQHKSNMNNQNLMDNLTSTSLANSRNNSGSLVNLAVDLNFDPAAVIDGNNTNDLNVSVLVMSIEVGIPNESFFISIFFSSIQLLPDSVVDPMELLSYLDPPNLNTPPSSGSSNNPNNDDILAALFD